MWSIPKPKKTQNILAPLALTVFTFARSVTFGMKIALAQGKSVKLSWPLSGWVTCTDYHHSTWCPHPLHLNTQLPPALSGQISKWADLSIWHRCSNLTRMVNTQHTYCLLINLHTHSNQCTDSNCGFFFLFWVANMTVHLEFPKKRERGCNYNYRHMVVCLYSPVKLAFFNKCVQWSLSNIIS